MSAITFFKTLDKAVVEPASRTTALLTDGDCFIGSHTSVALLEAGYVSVTRDNFLTSRHEMLECLEGLTGKTIICERGDALDVASTESVSRCHGCEAAIHLAGYKAVCESVAQPLKYFHNNIGKSVSPLQGMDATGAPAAVLSSCTTAYRDPASVPIDEQFLHFIESPYAQTKPLCKQILAAQCLEDRSWSVGVLCYFSPVSAYVSGPIGEGLDGKPNNHMPLVTLVAIGKKAKLGVFGDDCPTPDGISLRNYLHMTHLAEEHVSAIGPLLGQSESSTVNLKTGGGTSVLCVLRAFELASSREIPFEFVSRRPANTAQYFADVSLAPSLPDWSATRNIEDMCRDSRRWQQSDLYGFQAPSVLS